MSKLRQQDEVIWPKSQLFIHRVGVNSLSWESQSNSFSIIHYPDVSTDVRCVWWARWQDWRILSDSIKGSQRSCILTYNLKDGKAMLLPRGLGNLFILVSANQSLVKPGRRAPAWHQKLGCSVRQLKMRRARRPRIWSSVFLDPHPWS